MYPLYTFVLCIGKISFSTWDEFSKLSALRMSGNTLNMEKLIESGDDDSNRMKKKIPFDGKRSENWNAFEAKWKSLNVTYANETWCRMTELNIIWNSNLWTFHMISNLLNIFSISFIYLLKLKAPLHTLVRSSSVKDTFKCHMIDDLSFKY